MQIFKDTKSSILYSESTFAESTSCIKENEDMLPTLYSSRKHAYSKIKKISPPKKTENFLIKISDIVHISTQNIDCGYSLEPPFTI